MIDYEYLQPGACMERYPVVYHHVEQPGLKSKYLVLHEVYHRWTHNWNVAAIWHKYKGIVTWNPCVYEQYKDEYNMVYCDQFMNMFCDRAEEYKQWDLRPAEVCAMYGPPASTDEVIMNARYDVPLRLYLMGMKVDGYGVIPPKHRKEYRTQWHDVFRGSVPVHRKNLALGITKFSVCFENSRDPYWACGWVTEKIYDCLGSGCIPIYWGAPDVTDRIPAELFIDYRSFDSPVIPNLYKYLITTPDSVFSKMSRDGYDFHATVDFGRYLKVFESLE